MSIHLRMAWLLSLLLIVLCARDARAQTTALFVDSQAGDWIGGGKSATYTPVDGSFTATWSDNSGVSVNFNTPSFTAFWSLTFRRAGVQAAPLVGTYESARRAPFTSLNGLDVNGTGTGCDVLTGRFVVLEAVYDSGGVVTRFAADFEQHCEDGDPGLFGAIRYNSTISTLVPFGGNYPVYRLTIDPPANGSISGPGISCGNGGVQCVVSPSAPTPIGLLATAANGYLFAGWTGDCSGGPRISEHVNMQRECSASFIPFVPAAPRRLLVMTGSSDSVVRGSAIVESGTNATWTLAQWGNGFQVTIKFLGATDEESVWFLISPPTGQTFQVGQEYQGASTADATNGSWWSTADSRSCSGGASFMVRDWVPGNGGVPQAFSIDFQQACGAALYGTLQYDSAYAYGRLDTNLTLLHFKAIADQGGILSHSADQPFAVTPSAGVPSWIVKSDQSWLTATPPAGSAASVITARVKDGGLPNGASPFTGHLQVFARAIVNVPDPIVATLDVAQVDTTSRPYAIYRNNASGSSWFLPNQAPQAFGLVGDIPLMGDFDGDGTIDTCVYRPSTGFWYVLGQGATQWGLAGDIPVPGDYNGDGTTEFAVFRQGLHGAQWFIHGESAPRVFGLRGDIPVPGDYDGDGITDIAVFRPATGTWYYVRSSTGQTITAAFGLPGDIPLVADFDADRKTDFTVFRPSSATWYIALSGGGTYSKQFGLPGDVPVPMDVTGDGRAELRVWRPETGTWLSYDRVSSQSNSQQYGLLGDIPAGTPLPARRWSAPDVDADVRADIAVFRPRSGEWFVLSSASGYTAFSTVQWGQPFDVPVAGAFDGIRHSEHAVFRPATGEWLVRRFDGTLGLWRQWGLPGDVPVAADYNGDGLLDPAVYRPATNTWYVLLSPLYLDGLQFTWGEPGDVPITGDFDGDGRADFSVYRPSTGEWFVAGSSGAVYVHQFGLPGDVPIAADFDGDGRSDLAIFRPSTGEWLGIDAPTGALVLSISWGLPGDVPVAQDFDGDGRADIAVYRPSTGEWFVIRSSDNTILYRQWGLPGDLPIHGR